MPLPKRVFQHPQPLARRYFRGRPQHIPPTPSQQHAPDREAEQLEHRDDRERQEDAAEKAHHPNPTALQLTAVTRIIWQAQSSSRMRSHMRARPPGSR